MKAVPSREDVLAELRGYEQRLAWTMENILNQRWQSLDILEKRLMSQSPENKIQNEKRALDQLSAHLDLLRKNYFESRHAALDALEKRLLVLNPENIMKRGYAFVRRDEKIITSAADLTKGDQINIRFADGEKTAEIK